ncbi:molybdopterin molybdotransferase MoeA [Litorisediminicola beolgyonensis]|uniref:Molybdopterin molybdenumtransferase n=1 Tax=Litorisediminicola beolgyonensis TaxID=1173614 RepID=A0ABW3ZHI7_9RHOB
MISVEDALDALFSLVTPLPKEVVALTDADGRVLVEPVTAKRDQPPFAASAMDGYAVASCAPGETLEVIGESAAGHRFDGQVGPGQAVRIFTGAPVPGGATRVIIQEDTERDGDRIRISSDPETATHIRPAGADFRAGFQLDAPRRLWPEDIALLAALNADRVSVSRRPRVALISTGDELVMPGEAPASDQIVASNIFGLSALFTRAGAECRVLPIARDSVTALREVIGLVDDANLVVTIGGASVGDHDLVAKVAGELGLERSFYKVAMRPGKPLMAGRLGGAMMIGLPGNPVSAMVCGHVFVCPVLNAMQGLPAEPTPLSAAPLSKPVGPNGPREHYMRARWKDAGLEIEDRQDSSLLTVLSGSDALVVRPPNDGPRAAGELVSYLPLRRIPSLG